MKHQVIRIDEQGAAVQQFFLGIRDQSAVIEFEGKALCVLYPMAGLAYVPEGQLREAAGAWNLPDDVAQAIAQGNH